MLTFSVDHIIKCITVFQLALNERQDQLFIPLGENKAFKWSRIPVDIADAIDVKRAYQGSAADITRLDASTYATSCPSNRIPAGRLR